MGDRSLHESAGVLESQRADLCAIADQRDRTAFSRLFEFYAPRLVGFFHKRGLADQSAEDLTQDVMLTVWKKAKLYDPKASAPSTWIYTIARNRYVDLVRKERFVEPMGPWAEPAESPEGKLEASQLMRNVQSVLAEIPEEQACVVKEAYLSEKSFSRIAAEQALPLGTIKTRARLALNKLRTALGGAG